MMTEETKIKLRRSRVRMWVTYWAAAFVFGGAVAIIAYGLWMKDSALAKDTFNVVLPIGTAIVTYWFAGRSAEKNAEGSNASPNNTGQDKANEDGEQRV